jgi:hypothetical protein
LEESLDLRLVHLCEGDTKLFTFCKNVVVTGKSSVEMKFKVFDMVLLRDLHIIYMDRWARFASRSERHMDRLSFISFNSPIFSQDWIARRVVWSFWEAVAESLSAATTAVSSAKEAVKKSGEVGRSLNNLDVAVLSVLEQEVL